jgi:fibronectin type 3 domain-containing protein
MTLRHALLGLSGAAALSSTAAADLAGFVAFTRNVGGNTVIDVFVAVTNTGDRFLNVYAANSNGTYVQKAGLANKTWKPDMAGFTATRNVADDSFMTAGTFSGGSYGGEFYASSNTNGDPSFTGTSWNPTPASPAATAIPYVDTGAPENDGAGWYTGDPPSVDNAPENLAELSATLGTRTNSVKVSGNGAASSSAATHGIWVAHLVLAGTGRTLGEGGTATWTANASVNSGGSTVQGRYKLVAPSAPTAPTNVAASDGTSTANVTVTWSAVSGATGYKILRADGSATPTVQIGTSATASYTDATAVAGTLYNYAVKATSGAGDTAASTPNQGWRNIAAPTGVSATDGTSTANVTVTWSAAAGATGYKVFRAVGSGTATLAGSTAAGVLTYADTSAAAGTFYNYTVRATTAAGDSAASAANEGWRNVPAPTGVNATDGSSTANVTVTWTAVPGATGYKVFRAAGSATPTVQIGTSATASYADATAAAGTVYTYAVKASIASGDSVLSATNAGWRNVAAPAGVTATDGSSTANVTVTWSAVAGASGYAVFRANGSATPTVQIGTSATASYTDSTAVAGTLYNYAVKATTTPGASAASAANQGWRNVPAPTGVSATDGTSTANVTVTWNAVAGATGYKVFRAVGSGTATQLGSTASGILTFADGTAQPGTTYQFTVRATTAAGDSASSAADAGTRSTPAPTGVSATDGAHTDKVVVTWTAVAGATGYKIFRGTGSATPTTQVGTSATSSYTDTTAAPGTTYRYAVKATTAAGDSPASATDTGWRNFASPTGVIASDGNGTGPVTVTWNAASGATGYKVFRAAGSATPTQVGSTTASVRTFSDSAAVAGTLYKYTVKAVMTTGDSPSSAPDTGWRNVSAPVGTAASDGTFTTHVQVTWSAHANTAVTGYRILRRIGSAAETTVGNVTGRTTLSFNDTSIAVGSIGTYRVAALTAAGASAPSTTNTGYKKNTGSMPRDGESGDGSSAGGEDVAGSTGGGTSPAGNGSGALAGLAAPGTGGLADRTWTPVAGPGAVTGPDRAVAAGTAATCDTVTARVAAMQALAADADTDTQEALAALLAPAQAASFTAPAVTAESADCLACRILAGDLTLDGLSGADDLVSWIDAWSRADWAAGDLDRDGWIDDRDLAILLRRAMAEAPAAGG